MKRWLCVLVPVVVLASLIVWRLDQKKAEVAGQAQQRAARMKGPAVAMLAKVEKRSIISTYDATGTVEAPLSVKIAPKVTGRIEYLEVREGDRVKKGQVLVRVDDSEIEANVRQQMAQVAEAKYRLAQAQLNQTPADVSVNTQIRQQKASLASAQADLNQVRKSYDAQLAAAKANLSESDSKIENAKAAVKSAQANLENARTKYNRIHALYKQGYIAAQEVDDAKAAVTVQESTVAIAEGQLKAASAQRDAVEQQYNIVKEKGQADIEAARARVTQAQASLEYAKANATQKPAYRQSIAALKASVEAAEASLRSAQAKRRDTVLVSPLDGYVTGRFADPGAIASPTQPIIAVQFIKQVWVTVAVPEEACAKMHLNQKAKICFDAIPDRTFDASIIQINPSADVASRQFTVRAIMSNADNVLKPGMFAHVSIETDRVDDALTVPREAVKRDRDGSYVMIVDGSKKAKRVPVMPQAEDASYICIGDALSPGTPVVAMSAMPVREGQAVVPGGKGKGRGGEKRL